jgi:NADPH:quinone reductase-like Zn-dependent oxidoreductase
MAPPQPSYTKATHSATYPAIDPSTPGLSTDGKVVVVTGATSGIGFVAAAKYASLGASKVVITARDMAKGDKTLAELKEKAG